MRSTLSIIEHGFVRTYIFSTDHKMIAQQFLFMALFMMSIGGLMAMLMRWELAWPESAVPFFHWVPEPYMHDSAIPPNTYNSMFTMHATIMIFFVVMPILVGCFGNLLIPLMIGARDMAFPILNMLSFWVGAVAGGDHAVVILRHRRSRPPRDGPRTLRSAPSRSTPVWIGVKTSGASA